MNLSRNSSTSSGGTRSSDSLSINTRSSSCVSTTDSIGLNRAGSIFSDNTPSNVSTISSFTEPTELEPDNKEAPQYLEVPNAFHEHSSVLDDKNNDTQLPKYCKPNDELPSYSPAVETFGLNIVKCEFFTPYKINCKRVWQPMLMEINSTQLILYKPEISNGLSNLITSLFKHKNKLDAGVFGKEKVLDKIEALKLTQNLKNLKQFYDLLEDNKSLFEPINNRQEFEQVLKTYHAKIHHIYTLNNLRTGIAPVLSKTLTDVRYHNVLRLRIEMNQLLVQCWSFSSLSNWYWFLNVGRDICGDFDKMPRVKTIPRNLHRILNRFDGNSTEKIDFSSLDVDDGSVDNDCLDNFNFHENTAYFEVNNLPLLTKKLNHDDKIYIENCIPALNSYDKWQSVIISNNSTTSPFNSSEENIFITHQKVVHKPNLKGGVCRYFAIEQHGLVSIAN